MFLTSKLFKETFYSDGEQDTNNLSKPFHQHTHTYLHNNTMSAARLAKALPSLSSITVENLTVAPAKLSYHLPRTSQGNLPVYRTLRSQAMYTDVKRVQGNVVQFRNELQEQLPHIPKQNFVCHTVSGTLKIKGDHLLEVKKALDQVF